MRLGSRMTAAATTGPASGPLPASSQPATGNTPRFIAARSRAKLGRIFTGSPSGRRGAVLRLAALGLIGAILAPIVPGTQFRTFPIVGSVEKPAGIDHHGLSGHGLGAAHGDDLVGDVFLV